MNETLQALLDLSHELGRETRGLAILGEGNTSAWLDDDTFAVKASGSNLGTLSLDGLSACRFADVLRVFDEDEISDAQINAALLNARVSPDAKLPSTEALFHAFLLSLPTVNFVGHTHPESVNGVLCSPQARNFAVTRLFPDEIVCCGSASVFVPYCDPGVPLARAVRRETREFISATGTSPRVILLANHGMIALGKTPQAVLATTLMTEKAARIRIGAQSCGGAVPLSPSHVARIAERPDEAYRQRALNL